MNDKLVVVKYDVFLRSCENSWLVEIDKQQCYFPYSLCDLDEISGVVLCPLWLAEKRELESYVID